MKPKKLWTRIQGKENHVNYASPFDALIHALRQLNNINFEQIEAKLDFALSELMAAKTGGVYDNSKHGCDVR